MSRARWCVVAAMVAGLLGLGAAALAFSVSPPSLTIQAGGSATGMLTGLPVAADTSVGCLIANGTVPSYLTIQFYPPCGNHDGWSASMNIQTIPATPAQTYQITFEVCGGTGCNVSQTRQTQTILDSKTWTIVVTPQPLAAETTITAPPPGGGTPAPQATTPAPAASTTHAASQRPTPTPTHPAASPLVAATTSAPTSPPPASTPTPTPAPQAAGPPPGLVLDHAAVNRGSTLKVAGSGCTTTTAEVGIANSITGTASVGADGTFDASLPVPSRLKPGRYSVIASCGAAVPLSTFVDVKSSNVAGTVLLLIGAAIVMLVVGLVVGRLTRHSRPSA